MTWGFLSEAIADMMRGNFETFMGWTSLPGVGATCPIQLSQYRAEWNAEAFRAIACGDGPDQTNVSLDEFKLHIERLHQISPKLGTFSAHRAACLGWRYRPEDRFTGPWGSPRPDKSRVEGKPTAPLLFTSSEIDPVTPLRAAFEMSKLHEGSGVLVHEGSGHSIIAIPSECRHRWLRRYWATGELPPNGTVCKMECEPFEDCAYIPQLEPEAALSGASDMRKRAAWVARSWAEIPGINEFRL
jgi:pimeloyl-ACP methyl ester carboxylesterase